MKTQSLRAIQTITITTLSSLALNAYAVESECFAQTNGGHKTELCVTSVPFQHHYYTLKVDHALIFVLPDDYVEDVTLTHKIPKDAAIEFPLSMQGSSTVSIVGGCVPISTDVTDETGTIGMETGRRCSFKWGQKDILKDLKIYR